MKNIKKIMFLSSLTIACSVAVANDVKSFDLDISSKEGYRVYLENKIHNESILKDRINKQRIKRLQDKLDRQNCDLNLVRKAVVKIISDKNKHPVDKNKHPVDKNISKTSCKTNNCVTKYIPLKIEESYFKYKTLKDFKVTKKANVYQYPIIGFPSLKTLPVGTKFKADMYTKAGWVHSVQHGGWIKGYRIYPSLKNETTEYDIKKWGKTKIISKTICKE